MSGEISIYACGGTGTAVASRFEQYRDKGAIDGFAKVTPFYIDTSMSDINSDLPREFLYIFDKVDGSGKLRRENNEVIKAEINAILHSFRPSDLNVVVSSASGGSGAVIAGYLLNELQRRGETVIVITVGSCDSRIELENSIKTMRTYERAAVVNNMPVPLAYFENNSSNTKESVNAEIEQLIRSLVSLFSRQHRRLDKTDLVNWLNYTKVTDIEPRLVLLATYPMSQLRTTSIDVISVATLCPEGQDSAIGIPIEYQAVGYISDTNNQNIKLQEPVHYCIVDGVIPGIVGELQKQLDVFTEHRRSKTSTHRLVNNADIDGNSDEIFL